MPAYGRSRAADGGMVRWRTRHNRLQRRLTAYESKPSAATVTDPSPEPLQPHYKQSAPYRLPNEHMFHHRIGIRNSAGNPTATGVRLHWTGMSPRPAIDHGFPPVVPQAVPMLAGGDPAIGISACGAGRAMGHRHHVDGFRRRHDGRYLRSPSTWLARHTLVLRGA